MLLSVSDNSQTHEDSAFSFLHPLISMKKPSGEALPLVQLTVLLKPLTKSMFLQIGWEEGLLGWAFML